MDISTMQLKAEQGVSLRARARARVCVCVCVCVCFCALPPLACRSRQQRYRSRQEFMEDVRLMCFNALLYNGERDPYSVFDSACRCVGAVFFAHTLSVVHLFLLRPLPRSFAQHP
jgi:hypothetical protein